MLYEGLLLIKRTTMNQVNINSSFVAPVKKESISYVLFDKRFLHVGNNVNFNLFYHSSPTQMTLFLQSDTIFDEEQKKKLEKIEHLYIPHSEHREYEAFVKKHLQDILQDTSLNMDEKTAIIYTSSTELTHSLYDNPDALENVQRSENIVTPILQSVIRNKDTISSYMKIIEHDYYTHTHSLNVSIYSICLGAEIGLKEDVLASLGQAALLHDLGKSKIEHAIINKDGPLSEDEFQKIKNHPTLGYDIAISIGIKDENILDAIRHHHEKLNGRGYPDHLKNKELSKFARILGICDVFDALTTKRSYKEAMHSFDALILMKNEMNTHLDMKILNTFIKMLHK